MESKYSAAFHYRHISIWKVKAKCKTFTNQLHLIFVDHNIILEDLALSYSSSSSPFSFQDLNYTLIERQYHHKRKKIKQSIHQEETFKIHHKLEFKRSKYLTEQADSSLRTTTLQMAGQLQVYLIHGIQMFNYTFVM